MKKRIILYISAFTLMLNYDAYSATYTTVAGAGNWSDLARWHDGTSTPASALPGAGDDIVIDQSIDLDIDATVNSITYNTDWTVLNVGGGISLTVNNSITSNRTGIQFNLLNGASATTATGVTFTGSSTIVNNGSLSLGAGGLNLTNGSFSNYNIVSITGDLSINGGSFLNNSTSSIECGNLTMTGNLTANSNGGTIDAQAVLIDNTGAKLTNTGGTINAHGGIDVSGSTISNCVDGGNVNFWGTLDESGTCKLTGNTTLPVELISFYADSKEDVVEITWLTASEQASKFFQINHSVDGVSFSQLCKVTAAGQSSDVLQYNYEHRYPARGINYYQLIEFDLKGNTQNLGIVSAQISRNINFQESLIVQKGTPIVIQNLKNINNISLADCQGKINAINSYNESASISTTELTSGTYFLLINYDNYTEKTVIFIKD